MAEQIDTEAAEPTGDVDEVLTGSGAPAPDAELPDVDAPGAEDEAVEDEPYEHKEPTPVGHGIVQDNVTRPGVQTTTHVDTGESFDYGEERATAEEEAPVDDE